MTESEDSPEEEVEEAWEAEIAKRVERIKNGTAKGRLAEDVLSDLQARFQGCPVVKPQ
jgi:Putative addiction module component